MNESRALAAKNRNLNEEHNNCLAIDADMWVALAPKNRNLHEVHNNYPALNTDVWSRA